MTIFPAETTQSGSKRVFEIPQILCCLVSFLKHFNCFLACVSFYTNQLHTILFRDNIKQGQGFRLYVPTKFRDFGWSDFNVVKTLRFLDTPSME